MVTESEFLQQTDALFVRLMDALDALDVDIEPELAGNVLTIECENGSQIVVNRHVANREMWVAAKSGGFHFALQAGAWRSTRGTEEFWTCLSAALTAQTGSMIRLQMS